jgi:hypothetical protein
MATSGTYTFTVTTEEISAAALRLVGAYGTGETIPAQDLSDTKQALNMLLKEFAIDGLPLWCVRTVEIPMITGQRTYNLSTATGNKLPIRITNAYLRDATGNDVTISIVSRYDYESLGQKFSQGVPNQAFYDPQLGAGTLTVSNVPQDNTRKLIVVYQSQIQDVTLGTETLDFPQEAFRFLKFALADDISMEWGCPVADRQEIAAKASTLRMKFADYLQENASVYFTPNTTGAGAGGSRG